MKKKSEFIQIQASDRFFSRINREPLNFDLLFLVDLEDLIL
jgi:hypothetical protein